MFQANNYIESLKKQNFSFISILNEKFYNDYFKSISCFNNTLSNNQKTCLKELNKQEDIIIYKARQVGETTITLMYILDQIITYNKKIIIITITGRYQREIEIILRELNSITKFKKISNYIKFINQHDIEKYKHTRTDILYIPEINYEFDYNLFPHKQLIISATGRYITNLPATTNIFYFTE